MERQPGIVLGELLAHAGEVVSRETLREAVWGSEVHVDFDRGLAYCLSQIRVALGDSGDNPRFVQTIPKRGYRFVAPVESVPVQAQVAAVESQPSAATVTRAAVPGTWRWRLTASAALAIAAGAVWLASVGRPAPAPAVVAVSVFDNETGQSELDRPVAALSDLVVARLTTTAPGRLSVIGNAAVLRQPRNIRNLEAVARGVKADYVLLGQLQRESNGGYRFITHVIRLSDEAHLKANRLVFADGDLSQLDARVSAEFERAVATHVLDAGT